MLQLIFYLILIFSLAVFLILFSIYTLFLIYSSIKGSPYVATNEKKILKILEKANLEKNKIFYDLGCGDGRIVIAAVKNYQVKGIGIDVNPILLKIARFKAKINKLPEDKISFIKADILKYNFNDADYIYLFLMPELIKKIKNKLKNLKKGATIISHGFKIEDWDKFLWKKIDDSPFPTYIYKVK